MADNIIPFIILLFVSVIMIIIGVSQVKSQEPVGFYTGEEPPNREQIRDVALWNKKHGYMWIAYGLAIIGSFIICLFIKIEIVAQIVLLGVIVGALPIMMLYHSYLKKKLYK